jgi:hypothetical protein
MRIREVTDIRWTIAGTDIAGEGKILNISTSGLLLTTDSKFNPQKQGLLEIKGDGEDLPFGTKKGKVVWLRRMPEGRPGYQCGVEFDKKAPLDKPLYDWIDRKTQEISQAGSANILNHYIY